MRFYQVDAFTDTVFKGNPAAVCVSDSWLSDDIMLKLAIENNLSETAFAVGRDGRYGLIWFTPGGEIDLCGHATLATAFTIMNHVEPGITHVDFDTTSGHLGVDREGDEYTLDFPLIRTSEYTPEDDIGDAIGCEPVCCAIGYRDPIAMLPTDRDVIDLHPDITKIMNLNLTWTVRSCLDDRIDRPGTCLSAHAVGDSSLAGTGLPVNPLRRMLIAALTSLSAVYPHTGHLWMRMFNVFPTCSPHWEHVCDVPLGSTSMTFTPAHSALSEILLLSIPRELLTKPRVMLLPKDFSHSFFTFSLSITIMS